MGLFNKKAKDKAKAKYLTQEAERSLAQRSANKKLAHQPVKISAGNIEQDVTGLIQRVALRTCVQLIPDDIRQHWPRGQFYHEHTPTGLACVIEIGHTDGYNITDRCVIPRQYLISQDTSYLEQVAKAAGERLAKGVREYHNRTSRPRDQHKLYFTQPVDWAGPRLEAGPPPARLPTKEQDDKPEPASKTTGSAGPLCLLCGRENRDAFPDWDTCPHGVTDD